MLYAGCVVCMRNCVYSSIDSAYTSASIAFLLVTGSNCSNNLYIVLFNRAHSVSASLLNVYCYASILEKNVQTASNHCAHEYLYLRSPW